MTEQNTQFVEKNEHVLTQKDVDHAHFVWWWAAETNNSYERLQALSFCAAMSSGLKKIYKNNSDQYKEALKRHMEFYNTEGTIGSVVVGLSLAMEEEKAKNSEVTGDLITSMKLGLMGPIAGIGDTLIHGMMKSFLEALACTFALQGNPIGLVFLPIISLIVYYVGKYMCRLGYKQGTEAVPKLLESGKMNNLITAASILGLLMMGALSANYVKVSTPLSWTLQATGKVISLQDNLDAILPGMLQLLSVFGISYYFTHKGMNYIKLILFIILISIIAAFFGILG